MMHPHTELRFVNERIGYGVFATQDIPRGTITWARDALDRAFTTEQMAAMAPPYRAILDKYCFVGGDGTHILCWDIARFVNHSCAPTCLAPGYDFEVAVRDIKRGEELTDDYASLNLETDFDCDCRSAECRGTVRSDDALRLCERWDQQVANVFPRLRDLDQPLWTFVDEREKAAVTKALDAGARPESCRVHSLLLRAAAR